MLRNTLISKGLASIIGKMKGQPCAMISVMMRHSMATLKHYLLLRTVDLYQFTKDLVKFGFNEFVEESKVKIL